MTFGARAQHGANWEDYEEDFEESETIMDLLHFGNNKNGQPYDLDLELSGNREVLDLGGRHLATRAINVGFMKTMEINMTLMILDDINSVVDSWRICVRTSEPF